MAWFHQPSAQILRFYGLIVFWNEFRIHKTSKFVLSLMKSSQSNFNLRSPDCYLVCSYRIATVQHTGLKKKTKNNVRLEPLSSSFWAEYGNLTRLFFDHGQLFLVPLTYFWVEIKKSYYWITISFPLNWRATQTALLTYLYTKINKYS